MADALPAVVPYLYYEDATAALEFLVRAFGFAEVEAVRDDEGVVWHAQVRAGDGLVLVGPGIEDFGTRGITDPEWAVCRIHVLVDDLDAHHRRAVAEGATIRWAPAEHVGGERIYIAADPGGHQWIFAQPIT
jgi:uncharacterized glyoxalase superfamily protein PhnB